MKNNIVVLLEEDLEVLNFIPFESYIKNFEYSDYEIISSFKDGIFQQRKINLLDNGKINQLEINRIKPKHERIKIKKYDEKRFLQEEVQFIITGTNKAKGKKYNRIISSFSFDKDLSCITVKISYYYFNKLQTTLENHISMTEQEFLSAINELVNKVDSSEDFIKENISFLNIIDNSKQLKLKKWFKTT